MQCNHVHDVDKDNDMNSDTCDITHVSVAASVTLRDKLQKAKALGPAHLAQLPEDVAALVLCDLTEWAWERCVTFAPLDESGLPEVECLKLHLRGCSDAWGEEDDELVDALRGQWESGGDLEGLSPAQVRHFRFALQCSLACLGRGVASGERYRMFRDGLIVAYDEDLQQRAASIWTVVGASVAGFLTLGPARGAVVDELVRLVRPDPSEESQGAASSIAARHRDFLEAAAKPYAGWVWTERVLHRLNEKIEGLRKLLSLLQQREQQLLPLPGWLDDLEDAMFAVEEGV